MELKTTLVRFSVPNRQIEKKTEHAVCFDLIGGDKVWIPLKKVNIKPSDNENFSTIEMPKWVFLKTNLPMHFDPENFDYVTEYN